MNEEPYIETLGEVHGESSVVEKEPNEKGICKAVLNLQENGSDTEMVCKAFPYLQKDKEDEPNRNGKEECKAFLYLHVETEEPNKRSCKATSLQHGTMYEAYDENFDKLVKNDFATLCRSLEDYVMEIFDWWTLAFLNKVYKMMVALVKGIPAFETMLHYMKEINNIDYLVDKVNYVMVNVGLVWQPTCLALWWLLTPHSSLQYLHWIGCLSTVVGGQIFHAAVVVLLMSSWLGIMATSNMNPFRHVARQEHICLG